MKKLTPEQSATFMLDYLTNLETAKKATLKVGIQDSETHVYTDDEGKPTETVLDVGAQHEFGTQDVPRRSFLRTPFWVKRNELGDFIQKQFTKVAEKGTPAIQVLGLIGVEAQTISQDAFTNGGYGVWKPLAQSTIDEKGSSQILVDTNALRSSITYEVKA